MPTIGVTQYPLSSRPFYLPPAPADDIGHRNPSIWIEMAGILGESMAFALHQLSAFFLVRKTNGFSTGCEPAAMG
jgi:hypothetical protein